MSYLARLHPPFKHTAIGLATQLRGLKKNPRTQKKSKDKAKDSPTENRPSRGQRQECSKPRPRTKDTGASVFLKKNFQVSKKGTQKTSSQIFREVFGVFLHNFTGSKNSAVLEPKTGQFSRSLDFKAKDLNFEAKAKAKDFKTCPRSKGRSRGLHLCLEYKSNLLLN